jgi:DNA-directed RNA polymerase specialized sigma subunit
MPATDSKLLQNIEEWKRTKNPNTFNEIYKQLRPYVNYTKSKFKNSGLSPTVMDLEARKLIAQALENYSPSKGGVVTYVNQYLMKMNRFVNNNQGAVRLPENYSLEFSTFQNAYNDLRQRQNRDPSTLELADYLTWNPKKVEVFKMKAGGTVMETDLSYNKLYGAEDLVIKEALQFIRSKYGNEGELLISKLYGLNGEPKQSLNQIAMELKQSYSKLYGLKQKVDKDFKEYIQSYSR